MRWKGCTVVGSMAGRVGADAVEFFMNLIFQESGLDVMWRGMSVELIFDMVIGQVGATAKSLGTCGQIVFLGAAVGAVHISSIG